MFGFGSRSAASGAIFRFEKTMKSSAATSRAARPPAECRENEELFDIYTIHREEHPAPRRNHAKRTAAQQVPPEAGLEWDPISPSLAGELRHQEMHMWAKSRIDWATPLEQLSPGYEPVWRTPPPKSVPRVRTAWWLTEAHVRALVGPLLQEAPRTAMPSARCGLFGVQKVPKQVLRVIFDARPANEYLKPRGEQLVLFTVAMLVAAVSAYPFITSVDYRHFYYQFAIPLTLAWLFLIVFDVGGKYLPKVLPMGFREAVCIAQVASWVCASPSPRPAPQIRAEARPPPEMLDRLFKLPAMPAFVTLQRDGKEVGRVFVLLDGFS